MKNYNPKKPIMLINYISSTESSEKYTSDYAEELGIKVDENDPYSSFNFIESPTIEKEDNFSYRSSFFISIDELEKFISSVKKKGATHLDIYAHGDHETYNLNAVNFKIVKDAKEKEKTKNALCKLISKNLEQITDEVKNLQIHKTRLENELTKIKGDS